MTGEAKFLIGIGIATIALITGALFLFSRPAPESPILSRDELIPEGTHTKGNKSAETFLVEFSDFQCPACKSFQPTVDQLTAKYEDRMLFAYRHYPLDQHPQSFKAALAAEAAGVQGKFWEMGTILFRDQDRLSDTIYSQMASELQLDLTTFEASQSAKEFADKVTTDKTFALTKRLPGTPSFYLNGQLIRVSSPQDLVAQVEAALQ